MPVTGATPPPCDRSDTSSTCPGGRGWLIFLGGNWLTPHLYFAGMPVALFGAWTFSKLLHYDDDPFIVAAIVGVPLFFLVMLIPGRFSFETAIVDLLSHLRPTVNFTIRGALGLGSAFIAFQGAPLKPALTPARRSLSPRVSFNCR